ncbi:MAG: hypothetical protein GY722_15105 [bacterium]|nr:hypothetical protein [bacterium]
MLQLSQEMSGGSARLRVDVYGPNPVEYVLEDMNFLNYRLAAVNIEPDVKLDEPDIVWNQDGEKSISYDGKTMTLTGEWDAGPLQKVIVTMLAIKMEAEDLHPSHSAAARYKGKTMLFLGGESNHGKSMGLIEALRRGGLLVSTETTVINDDGISVMGSEDMFLKKRAKGTERADKASPNKGVEKFFGEMPTYDSFEGDSNIDLVIVPSIDGNYDPATTLMGDFEAGFQMLHSLQNYFLLNELLAVGHVMPMVDTEELRAKRADFVERFVAPRKFYMIRAATPQVLMDEIDKLL